MRARAKIISCRTHLTATSYVQVSNYVKVCVSARYTHNFNTHREFRPDTHSRPPLGDGLRETNCTSWAGRSSRIFTVKNKIFALRTLTNVVGCPHGNPKTNHPSPGWWRLAGVQEASQENASTEFFTVKNLLPSATTMSPISRSICKSSADHLT